MTTISTPSNRHIPVMPLPMATYAYRYPNSDSQPYASIPNKCGIYNPALPGIYKWENNLPETTRNLTYLAPLEFKEPPKHYALASNWPRENYSPLPITTDKPVASKGYVPHFTNKTNQSWKMFLNETPERFLFSASAGPTRRIDFGSAPNVPRHTTGTLDSDHQVRTGNGADFTQRPQMALSSQFRNNNGAHYTCFRNTAIWKPYGNSSAHFNTYVMGAPKFSNP